MEIYVTLAEVTLLCSNSDPINGEFHMVVGTHASAASTLAGYRDMAYPLREQRENSTVIGRRLLSGCNGSFWIAQKLRAIVPFAVFAGFPRGMETETNTNGATTSAPSPMIKIGSAEVGAGALSAAGRDPQQTSPQSCVADVDDVSSATKFYVHLV
jgi:hypothetical protein